MAKPVDIGHFRFATQSAATKHFREILNSRELGEDVEGEDARDLCAVLVRHPDFVQKVGVGVRRFYVDKSPDHPTRCFWLERGDGSVTDFSCKNAITGRNTPPVQAVVKAFRETVAPVLISAKRRHFDDNGQGVDKLVPCEVTGELISHGQAHLSHMPPSTFEMLVRTFLAVRGVEPRADLVAAGTDAQSAAALANPELGGAFVECYRKVAVLRIVKAGVSLRSASAHRVRQPKIPIVL